jgi:hypothetical protein
VEYLVDLGQRPTGRWSTGAGLEFTVSVVASEARVTVAPEGAVDVLFTDGISERRHSGRFFEEDLASVLADRASPPDLAEVVRDEAVASTTDAPDDDMALLVLLVPTVGHTATPKPSDSSSVAGTRR